MGALLVDALVDALVDLQALGPREGNLRCPPEPSGALHAFVVADVLMHARQTRTSSRAELRGGAAGELSRRRSSNGASQFCVGNIGAFVARSTVKCSWLARPL